MHCLLGGEFEALSVYIKILHNFLNHFTEVYFDPLVNALQVAGLFLSSGASYGTPHFGHHLFSYWSWLC